MTNKEIRSFLKERRIKLGLTQEYIGDKLGVNKSTVSRWESDETERIKRSHIIILCNEYELPSQLFLGDDDVEIEDPEIVTKRREIVQKLKDFNLIQLEEIDKYIKYFIDIKNK